MSSYFCSFQYFFFLPDSLKFLCYCLSVRRTPLCHSLRVYLLVKKLVFSPSSENVFIFPSFLKGSFTRYRICSWQFFSFSSWKMLSHFCQASVVSDEKSTGIWIGVPQEVVSLCLLSRFILCLVLRSLIMICLIMDFFGSVLSGFAQIFEG